jgi:hypothetical protein
MNTRPTMRPDREQGTPWPGGARYDYRRGAHELVLSSRGVDDRQAATIGRAEAEFALVVEGPLLVLGYRFGVSGPWSYTAPFNWHMVPRDERTVPAEVELSGATYSRLWATLRITLVDAESGAIRARRAVALRPEFTRALHATLRRQAREPFCGAVGDHALAWLHHSDVAPVARAVARARSAATSRPEESVPTACGRLPDGSPRHRPTRGPMAPTSPAVSNEPVPAGMPS